MRSGPAALLIYTISPIFLTATVDTDSSRSSDVREDFTADYLLNNILKQAQNICSSSGNMASHMLSPIKSTELIIQFVSSRQLRRCLTLHVC